jgi:hypothetical protein
MPLTPSTTPSWAQPSRPHAAAELSGAFTPEDGIPAIRLAALAVALAAVSAGTAASVQAQQDEEKDEDEKEEQLERVWQIDGLRSAFCVQLLLDPAKLEVPIPRASRPLRADAIEQLSPPLRSVVESQPEYGALSPSRLCLYYMESVDAGSVRVTERDPSKAPMIGVWVLAAADAEGGARKDVVLRLFTNTGRLKRVGQVNGLDLRTVRSTVRDITNEEDASAPPIGTRYQLKLGKTLLTWDGRRVSDSTRANGPVSNEWRADTRRRGPMTARMVLNPEWTQPMVGSLRVEGDDDFADAIKASPIRFVGPAALGGRGELAFGR